MAFDFASLTGYRADMTDAEKLALLETYEAPAPDLTGFIAKSAFDKVSSDLADWKRKHNLLLSEEQKKEQDRLEAEQAIKDELETLRKENAVNKSKADFLSLGYADALAEEAAVALIDGDMAKFNAVQKSFIESVRNAERAAALANDPKPQSGGLPKGVSSKKDFDALTSKKQMEFMAENANWREIIAR